MIPCFLFCWLCESYFSLWLKFWCCIWISRIKVFHIRLNKKKSKRREKLKDIIIKIYSVTEKLIKQQLKQQNGKRSNPIALNINSIRKERSTRINSNGNWRLLVSIIPTKKISEYRFWNLISINTNTENWILLLKYTKKAIKKV